MAGIEGQDLASAFRPRGHVAVFQPRPGLGDLIWHLPLIRALAREGAVTLVTKPSTQADVLLAQDPAIARVVWFDGNPRQGRGVHDGPAGFLRLVGALRAIGAGTGVLLHHGAWLAAAMRLAGIGRRYGYGASAAQRAWLNRGPFLDAAPFTEAAEQASAYAALLGLGCLPEPSAPVDAAARARVLDRLRDAPRPWTVLGVGSHGAARQWGAARFAAFAGAWLQRGPGCVLVLASAHEAALAEQVAADHSRCRAAVGWGLPEAAALLAEAETFVGNDSGLLNLRAAVGRSAYGLFGASGPLRHSALIHPIVPPEGPRAGMSAISVQSVLDALR